MGNQIGKKKVLTSLLWKYMEQGTVQFVQLVITIILARLLDPEAYGTIGLITIFIAVSGIFITQGFNTALVRKKTATEIDYDTAFYCNLAIAFVCYLILFVCAPAISRFYKEPILIPILRVEALTLITGSLTSILGAILQRRMQFKSMFYRGLIASLTSGVFGVFLAYSGFGVWSLSLMHVTSSLVSCITLWIGVKWFPKFRFSKTSAKSMFDFGYKILLTSVIDTIYNNMYSLVIGKVYNKNQLAFYNKGKQWPNMLIVNLNGSIQSVMLPVLSQEQDNKKKMKAMVRRTLSISSFLVFPAMAGLAAVARPLTIILLTEKWLPSVAFMQFCCFTYALWPIHTANLQAIQAVGRSDIILKVEIIKKTLGVVALVVTIPFGIYPMMWARCIQSFFSLFINSYPNIKLLDYGLKEQLKDIFPSMFLSIFMCVIVIFVGSFIKNNYLCLLCELVVGAAIYIIGAKLLKLESFDYILGTVKKFLKNRKAA